MEPRAVAEAVETGKEDVIMEALRSYNQEVSGRLRRGAGTEGVGQGRARRRVVRGWSGRCG